jgi:hypothetical protein
MTVGSAFAQQIITKQSKYVLDTVINGEHVHIQWDAQVSFPNNNKRNKGNKGNYDNASIINKSNSVSEQKSLERQAIDNYIDSMRVIYFTNIIGFSKNEAATFWLTYNDYQNKLDKIWERRQEVSDKLRDPFGKYKTREYAAFVDTELKLYREEALVREQYAEKFKTILGENFYLFYRAEDLFRRWIYTIL